MFLIYGRRTARIKRYTDHQQACQSCKVFDLDVKVYRDYYHLFYIPVLPAGYKTVDIRCKNCGEPMRSEVIKKEYEQITRTPFYLFALPILFATLIPVIIYADRAVKKERADFVANPKVGDVYRIRKDENNTTTYYFLRLASIRGDTLVAYHSHLEYSKFVTRLNEDDFFVKDEEVYLLRAGLKQMLDDGEINSVERDYGNSRGFNRIR